MTENQIPWEVEPELQPDAFGAVSTISVRDTLDILFRRRRLFLGVVVLVFLIGILVAVRPRSYTANGSVRIKPGAEGMYRTSPMADLSGDSSRQIESEAAIMQSRTLYLEIAKELNLINEPAFWGMSRVKPRSVDDARARERLIRRMRKVIQIHQNPNNNLIYVSCTTTSPALSAKIANTLINSYIEYLFRMRYGSTKRASDWLIGQLGDLKQQIGQEQAQIIELQQKLGIVGLNEQNTMYLQTQLLDSLTKEANTATVDRILAEAKLHNLEDSDPGLIEGEVNLLSPGQAETSQAALLPSLRNAQAQSASNYARLLAQFGPNFPEVREQKAQLDEITKEVKTEEQRILNQARVSYAAAKANESMQNGLLRRKTKEAFASGGTMARYVLLLHDYQSSRSLYEELVLRLRESTITSGLEAGGIDIVDLADLPAIPNPPGPLMILVGFLIVGLIAGCIVALTVNALDVRVTTVEQVQRASNLPILASIPRFEVRKSGGKLSNSGPAAFPASADTRYTEGLQLLRSSILLSRPGSPPKVILITSSIPAEGKSTTSLALATAFAAHGARVLLVDADLRRGSIALRLGLKTGRGLSTLLTQNISLEEAIEASPQSKTLSILGGGPHAPDPAVLVASSEMARVIRECTEMFDFVIVDAPPVLGLSDTINLGRLAEAVVMVVREEYSSHKAIKEAVRRLQISRLPVIGVAFNDVDIRAHSYSYGYGYEAYAGYYRGQDEDR